jgi:hypothetical protein
MLIDLGMPLDPSTPVYPGDPPFEAEDVFTVAEHGCRVRRLSFSSHFGTHVDTPCHMIAGGKTLDAFPLTTLIGPACVLDLRGRDPITEHDLPATLPAPRVLLLTGHSEHRHDPQLARQPSCDLRIRRPPPAGTGRDPDRHRLPRFRHPTLARASHHSWGGHPAGGEPGGSAPPAADLPAHRGAPSALRCGWFAGAGDCGYG